MNTASQQYAQHRLNIGCGRDIQPGFLNVDRMPLPGVDIEFDLENCDTARLPLADNSVREIRLHHVIEHIKNPLALMQELYRVAANHCKCTIHVPHGASDDAWADPTHVRPYFAGSFGYFSQPHYWRADYGYRGDWQPVRVDLQVPHERFSNMDGPRLLHAVRHERNVVSEIRAEMRAIKPGRAPIRSNQMAPEVKVNLV